MPFRIPSLLGGDGSAQSATMATTSNLRRELLEGDGATTAEASDKAEWVCISDTAVRRANLAEACCSFVCPPHPP